MKWYHKWLDSKWYYCDARGEVIAFISKMAGQELFHAFISKGNLNTEIGDGFIRAKFAKQAVEDYTRTHEAELVK